MNELLDETIHTHGIERCRVYVAADSPVCVGDEVEVRGQRRVIDIEQVAWWNVDHHAVAIVKVLTVAATAVVPA
jgi:hypothetical protein